MRCSSIPPTLPPGPRASSNMCPHANVQWCAIPRMHKGRGQRAPLDASSWSRSHSTPCFALPLCALCSLCSVRLGCISLPSHWHEHRGCLLCVREKLLAQRAPGSNCLLQTDFVQAGSSRARRVLFLFSSGKITKRFAMRWTHQYLKWGVIFFSFSFNEQSDILLTGEIFNSALLDFFFSLSLSLTELVFPCETLSRISLMYAMWRLQVALCTLSVLSLSSAGESKARSCSEVRQAYNVKGFSIVNVPHQEISGRRNWQITTAFRPPFTTCHFLFPPFRLNNLMMTELCNIPQTFEPSLLLVGPNRVYPAL